MSEQLLHEERMPEDPDRTGFHHVPFGLDFMVLSNMSGYGDVVSDGRATKTATGTGTADRNNNTDTAIDDSHVVD